MLFAFAPSSVFAVITMALFVSLCLIVLIDAVSSTFATCPTVTVLPAGVRMGSGYMFCPKCKAEYREGFAACADCNLPLVDKLPEEPPIEYVKFKELFYTFNPADIAFIKSLFESHNITYYIQGENFMLLRPLAQPAGIMVDEQQFEEAKELLKEFKERFTGLSSREGGQ